MPSSAEELQARMARLEETLYFQENTLKQLNEALTLQQYQLDTVERQLRQALEKLNDVQSMVDQGGEASLPPHSVQKAF
ncbi:MAG: SlyX family protein [Desulfovibrionaceae bacterium]